MSLRNAERVAHEIIESYGIITPEEIDIEAIALDRRVFVNDTSIEGSVARLLVKEDNGLISVDNGIIEPGRRRFAIAHELGHFELHRNKTKVYICDEKDFLSWHSDNEIEFEANVFAAELLLPANIFRKFCSREEPNFNFISSLAAKFNTSLTATAFRYVEKGYFPCALVASVAGRIKWMTRSPDFSSWVKSVDTPLHKFSVAGASLSGEEFPDKPEIVEEEYWLETSNNESGLRLYEHSIALPYYNTILSLLYFN